MDYEEVGVLNVGVLGEIVEGAANVKGCMNVLKEGLRRTSHLVKAVSVARAVGRCPFEARLVEIMGASDVYSSTSVFPGKGEAVHQVLAIAVPRLFHDFLRGLDFSGALNEIDDYIWNALEELRGGRVPPVSGAKSTQDEAVVGSAGGMAKVFVKFVRGLYERGLLDPSRCRVRAELELFDYKLHVRGIADLVLEDAERGRAVVVEWKTSRGKGETPSDEEIVQGYIYSVAVAHRLGYGDGTLAVLNCDVFPVIIRDSGRINPYSVSKCYPTAERQIDEERILSEVRLAATHLVLYLIDYKRKVDSTWDSGKEMRLCGREVNGRWKSAFRMVPRRLMEKRYSLNPRVNKGYPCNYCSLRSACEFYVFSKQEPEEVDRLAWKSRYRVFGQRENAFMPLHYIATKGEVLGVLEGGSRADMFEWLDLARDEVLGVVLKRRMRLEELEREFPKTVREGKPVILFLSDVEEPIYRTGFSGNVGSITIDDEWLYVHVTFEGRFSRFAYFLLKDLVEREPELRQNVFAVETNIDLTHIELMAIDAFQRATRTLLKQEGSLEKEMLREIKKAVYEPKRLLFEIFGLNYAVG